MLKPILCALLATAATSGLPSARAASAAKSDVVMYATRSCGYCARAREHFRARGVQWDERDVETSAQAAREWKALGGTGTPVIVIGDERIVGFQPQRIDAALAKRGAGR